MRTLTGEEMPYATLMYVRCNAQARRRRARSPSIDRVRTLVLESGPARLRRWLDYERDVRVDFEKAFGEPPGALGGVGIALMTDSDKHAQHRDRVLRPGAARRTDRFRRSLSGPGP